MKIKYMPFPPAHFELMGRYYAHGQVGYTVRTHKEFGKYKVGDIIIPTIYDNNKAVGPKFIVDELHVLKTIKDYPFYNELTDLEKKELEGLTRLEYLRLKPFHPNK
jgi:hypothetical protein